MAGNKIFRVLTSIFFKGKIYSEGSLIEVTSEEYIKCFANDKKLVEYVKDVDTPKEETKEETTVETPKEETDEVETPPQPSPEGREEEKETPKVEIKEETKYPINKAGAKK